MIKCVVVVPTFNFHLVNQMINQSYVSICAIVTNDRIVAAELGLPKKMTYAVWQFREAVQSTQPDFVFLLTSPANMSFDFFKDEARAINFPARKIIPATYISVYQDIFDLGKRFETFEKSPDKYRIFATGLSYTMFGIRPEYFDLPLINFAFGGQDLYYDYQIAKRLLNELPPPV